MIENPGHLQGNKKSELKTKRFNRAELANLKNYIFGSSAAIITDASLIVGLGSAQASKGAILGGLLTIAL
ncbi:MAG TPA: hypothetical protein VMS73_10205, partial [Anaerolineaceae bacterium]|nr:hypothetical protein [Anaerolineaceae bacterium]